MTSDTDEATLELSRPVEGALTVDAVGAAEILPFSANPDFVGLLHLPRPCPAT